MNLYAIEVIRDGEWLPLADTVIRYEEVAREMFRLYYSNEPARFRVAVYVRQELPCITPHPPILRC
jgi:hypothetical protein